MKPVATGDVLHHQLKDLDIVRRGDRIGVFKIDLVLTGSHFMVGSFNLKTQLVQSDHDVPAAILPQVHGSQIKVATLVV